MCVALILRHKLTKSLLIQFDIIAYSYNDSVVLSGGFWSNEKVDIAKLANEIIPIFNILFFMTSDFNCWSTSFFLVQLVLLIFEFYSFFHF